MRGTDLTVEERIGRVEDMMSKVGMYVNLPDIWMCVRICCIVELFIHELAADRMGVFLSVDESRNATSSRTY